MYTLYIWNIILIEKLDGEIYVVLVTSGSTVPTAPSNQILSATQLSLMYKLDTASLTRHQAGVLLQLLTDTWLPHARGVGSFGNHVFIIKGRILDPFATMAKTVLVLLDERNRLVTFSGTKKNLLEDFHVVFQDQLACEDDVYLQIKDESWGRGDFCWCSRAGDSRQIHH